MDLLRSDLFSVEQLKQHAVMLAGQHAIDPYPRPDRLLPRLADNADVLRAAYDVLTVGTAQAEQRTLSGEIWLLDNFYLIEQQIILARRHLPVGYGKQLPRLQSGSLAGFPRVYDLASELIAHQDARVDGDNVSAYIHAYQTITALTLGELWAFPIMLQLALLENLRRASLNVACRREERNAAMVWADRMLAAAEKEPKLLIQLLAEFAHADMPLTAPFVEEFYARLQAYGPAMAFVQTWVEHKLLEQGITATQLSEVSARNSAANQISMANSIGSLNFLAAMDWRIHVEAYSVVEQSLRQDPMGIYDGQDFATRDRYRHAIEDIARSSGRDELAVAEKAIALAQAASQQTGREDRSAHVGYYLLDRGRQRLDLAMGCHFEWRSAARRMGDHLRLSLYISAILLLTLLISLILRVPLESLSPTDWRIWWLGMVGVVSISALAVSLVNRLITLFMAPGALPQMDFSQGVPDAHRCMVVIPTLLSSPQEIDALLEAQEIRYLGNRDSNIYFALLTDFRDAAEQTSPEDALLIDYARVAIQTLNARYIDDRPCLFYWFHRPRVWNPFEQVWMGYERKRGKLEQFNALLRGAAEAAAFSEQVGDLSILSSIRYVITLDTDTQLPRDTARALIGHMAHPLNQAVYDVDKGRIVDGYAIIQPRVAIDLTSAGQSLFTKLMAGDSGIDPYTREVSDVYQDIFSEGSFIGKGIYAVDAFRQAVDGRFPENLILSHDLLEGGYARAALATSVVLIEELPGSYTAEVSRRHRWIRGDWQIIGWLLPSVPGVPTANGMRAPRPTNPLSGLSIWKIFDNLRRSLVSSALLLLLAGGWLLDPAFSWLWTTLVTGIILVPVLLSPLIDLFRKPQDLDWATHLSLTRASASRPLFSALLTVALLPYDAVMSLDAILRSGIRMLFTRRGLLLWQLPSYRSRNACHTPGDFFRELWSAPLLAILLGIVLVTATSLGTSSPSVLLFSMPILGLWLFSPVIAWRISQPLGTSVTDLNDIQRRFLRLSARRTWRFFDDFVGPAEHWLPPDNFQEYPTTAIASRTSPTNMGMSLLASLAAYDFGYITVGELLQLTENTVTTMEQLERYHGHFYNWYDTRTLQILSPQYISAVDSGNLGGCLLTLQAGLNALKTHPVLPDNAFAGLQDTLYLLATCIHDIPTTDLANKVLALQDTLSAMTLNGCPPSLVDAHHQLADIQRISGDLVNGLPADVPADSDCAYWAQAFYQQCQALALDLKILVPDARDVNNTLTLTELAHGIATGTAAARAAAAERLRVIDQLVDRCHALAAMDFAFLYDPARDLLAIGYDVGERRRDPSCYDLLASEARLASFLLIAQGQAPQKHWFSLGRLLTSHGGELCLISWSGSMFEYLMPQLIMPDFRNTLLYQTCKAAVSRQIEYGRQRSVPWGISESCFNAVDMHQAYQYRAFGVPGLGFKRGLGDDLVVAPYASALALTVMPWEACINLQNLAAQGFLGAYGFYEAIDYTPSRVPPGESHAIVRTFMAHHQGMSLLAFAHALLNQPMQRRFLSDPGMQATQLLLQERLPRQEATFHPHAAEVSAAANVSSVEITAIMRVYSNPDTSMPEVHLLSNGRYHIMINHAGSGYSHLDGLAVNRWREDTATDAWGTFIYLRDRHSGRFWSTTHQPTRSQADHYEAIFVQARAEYRRRDQMIESYMEVSVAPEDNVEIRRVTLTNISPRIRQIELTSYTEIVLAPLNADLAHRAFSNLFVQTEILSKHNAILCTRRRRSPDEQVPWMFHLFAAPGVAASAASYETDRAQFIGRGRTAEHPRVFDSLQQATLSNSEGPVLDPVVAIRRTLTLGVDESATVQIISGMADTREAAIALLEKYGDRHLVERAFEMAWFQSQEVLRHLSASEADAQVFGRLANSVVYASGLRRAAPSVIARNQLGQSGLWRFGISGDLPIVLLRLSQLNRINLVKQILQAHAYWRLKGLTTDLVIVNEDFTSYRATLQDQIMGLIHAGPEAQVIDKPGGVFLRRAEELSEEDRVLFQTVARIILTDSADSLLEQVERRVPRDHFPAPLNPQSPPAVETIQPLLPRERIFFNGLGGFTADGREYVISMEPGQNTPAPWANVIASPHIGTVISESGGAYTWVENAHEFRLTTWHNDPLSDSSGEALYIRDEDTGAFWSPSPLPARGQSGYVCRHGFGYTIFEHYESGISSEMTTYVAMDAPVKFVVVKLHNHSKRQRRLSLTAYWELVLGEWRHANMMHIVTESDPHNGALYAHNDYGRECGHRVVFVQTSERERTITGNRSEFIGRNGTLAKAAALYRSRLSDKTGAGFDPCAAIQTPIHLAEGAEREIVFVFGTAASTDEAQQYSDRFANREYARQALAGVQEYWSRTLGTVYVETPDPALNVLANGWLLYQTISSRLWGRSGYYQSGGAYGFRDQLQDSMALIHTTPELAREQLIRCAERQFCQGDVQHWWHPPHGQGVRTHISDDYLWLPYATCRFVMATGDTGILDEPIHFLEGRELNSEEESYYDQPQRSAESASLYDHCVRALKNGLRLGVHGLPLMGCGDWNDGMNLVGHEGRGESVWLAWFLIQNLQQFAGLARSRGDRTMVDLCVQQAAVLQENIEKNAWDGAWYRRAYFDDGTPLGSVTNDECQIDSISQSWSILSSAGDPLRARQAMAALDKYLIRRDAQLIQLLNPPFDRSVLEPGYIKGYVPGVRENGGQYTHAAIWAAMAFAQMGDKVRAWELFDMLNPVHHGSSAESIARYKVESYVMCADIYGATPHIGRGGWTWYTGAAGWMYRLTIETLLGLSLEVDHLHIKPCIPADWKSYKVHYRYRDTMYHITVHGMSTSSVQVVRITLDGTELPQDRIPLMDDRREHTADVYLD
ncbi:GH36-type glycosyl hydrolase domain-containing protein [Acidithiobacillus thiooxidans]|uniref:GH36-type glycosyl hydrolase domain-containing protein n=2 Tax=Acidithiobacillus thiooxidans TaxID=930 RepID=UPI001D02DAA2|nr:glucoamylase family protein [Acidithiobacillus thiooxidans]